MKAMEQIQLSEYNLDKFTPHCTWLKPRIALEASLFTANLLSQYLCETIKLDSKHVVCNIRIKDARGHLKIVRVLNDCGATSIFVSPQLIEWLGLENLTVPAYTTTLGINGNT